MDAFYKIATSVYDTHQNIISSYLADIIIPERDRPFYIKVMQHHTQRYQSIEHYKRLREVMNPAEKEHFIHSLRNDWQPNFYIQVLEVEQDWDTLLKTAKAYIQSINYLLYLKVVVAARTQECWALTTERIPNPPRRRHARARVVPHLRRRAAHAGQCQSRLDAAGTGIWGECAICLCSA